MKNVLSLILIVSLIGLYACQNKTTTSADTGGHKTTNLDANSFEKRITEANAQLIDVRTPEEYAQGHLPGALLMNFQSDDFMTQVQALDKNKSVYVYCRSGGRSGSAMKKLSNDGFKDVVNLLDGITGWFGSGKQVVK